MREPRIKVGLFRMILGSACAMGAERAALLAEAGVEESALIDPDRWVPLSAQLAVGRRLIERVGGGVAPLVMRHFALPSLGALGYAMAHSATVGDALAVFVRYQTVVTDAAVFRLIGAAVEISAHRALTALGRPLEGMLAMVATLARVLAGEALPVVAVELAHPAPDDRDALTALFGVTPRFEASAYRIGFDRAALAAPVRGAHIALQPALLALLDADDAGRARQVFSSEVVGALRALLPQGVSDKAAVAKALGVSARTLARRLSAEGTTFQALLDDVRQELACHWLADPRLAVYEVAFMLGYSESGAFHRAFRRWTGQGPAQYRAAQYRAAQYRAAQYRAAQVA